MRLQITLLDMGEEDSPFTRTPTVVLQLVIDTDHIRHPLIHNFPLPATMDARERHPYAIMVTDIDHTKADFELIPTGE